MDDIFSFHGKEYRAITVFGTNDRNIVSLVTESNGMIVSFLGVIPDLVRNDISRLQIVGIY